MPKFKQEGNMELTKVLPKIGFGSLFEYGNLKKIGEEWKLSRALHKAFVEVDEEGTVAAAATAMVFRCKSLDSTKEFIVDRPFLFFIKHDPTNTILFMGKIVKL